MAGGLRVAVTGATGNIGTSVIGELATDERVGSILGIARRPSDWQTPKLELSTADVARDELDTLFSDVDVVIHLAWLFQPTHDPITTWRANVLGSKNVFSAVARNRVPGLVYSSSVGAYSPASDGVPVTEDWPTDGWPGAAYTREKAYLERVLDVFERDHPDTRVVRIRPAFVFKKEAAAEQRRLFAGPLLPGRLVRPQLVPLVPDIAGLRVQAVHASDVADAFRISAVSGQTRGAYNIAAEPVIDANLIADLLGARDGAGPRRSDACRARRGRVASTPGAGIPRFVRRSPPASVDGHHAGQGRTRWAPRYTATDAIEEFLDGLREGSGLDTPPLEATVPGGRLRELATGVGRRP